MEIRRVTGDKKEYIDLLLLADEQESMIDRYLGRGEMFVLDDDGVKAECVITSESAGVYELKNIAVCTEYQRRGYGKRLIDGVFALYADLVTLYVGTGDVPSSLGFYHACGFTDSHRVKNFFTDNYDHLMFEDGIQLVDMVYLKREKSFGRANLNELEAVMALYREAVGSEFCVWNEYYPGEEELTHDYETGNLFVIRADGKVIGAASAVPENEMDGMPCWSTPDSASREIARVVVAASYRGRGLAVGLVRSVMRTLKAGGTRFVRLSVAACNIPALKTYIKLGFTTVGEADMYGNRYNLMQINLNPSVSLRPMTDGDLPLYEKWLHTTHVGRWYHNPGDWLDEFKKRDGEFAFIHHFVAEADGVPFGACQYYSVAYSDEDWSGYPDTNGAYSIDYLIGEEAYLHRGLGKGIVAELMRIITEKEAAERVIVQPEPGNGASRGLLLAAGFSYIPEYDLFVKKVRIEQ